MKRLVLIMTLVLLWAGIAAASSQAPKDVVQEWLVCVVTGDTAGLNAIYTNRYKKEGAALTPLVVIAVRQGLQGTLGELKREEVEILTRIFEVKEYQIADDAIFATLQTTGDTDQFLTFILTRENGDWKIDLVLIATSIIHPRWMF
jgi:hypothetical protein